MKTTSFKKSVQQGFSLVELLVVIAVIAIIAAIAIPNIANITSQAKVAKNQRNAQNLASVAAAAKAAGYPGALNTPDLAISLLASGSGVAVTNNNQVMTFSVTELTGEEETGVREFLNTDSNTNSAVTYVASGTTVVSSGT